MNILIEILKINIVFYGSPYVHVKLVNE
jgi:hypothetical protein